MLREKLKTIPHLPGSYQMRNINNTIIYVGKAISLRKRVRQYFQKNNKIASTTFVVYHTDNFNLHEAWWRR